MYDRSKLKASDEYMTPDWLFKALDDRFNFTVDAACTRKNDKVRSVIHQEDGSVFSGFEDGLKESWSGHRVFCNPPYSQKKIWIQKAKEETDSKCPLVVMPLPCTMEVLRETKGYHYDILSKRVSFIDPKTGEPEKGNRTVTIIVYFWGELI